ncbi:TetR family transcriptional regulator [Nocardia sp. SYP-A9097]|uniref:TetR/AcrR family transcriptional regulator n=1 Tax=Nocardia sp. SYP-A9097 TaxID=2663237 RepID=UPI00129B7CFB|nr:TetR/AcrR family transcriptional regulator [Nocardia sp. SYP-A9097]MRH87886.1 TetR family transcriptional regulator [Nocardia sp. SYP-A9097]
MASEDRRSRRTRRLLREAFVALILERGYSAVRVEEITERADLGRATFYTHFADKDALLDSVVSELIDEMHLRLQPLMADSVKAFTGKPVLELFRLAAHEREAYRVVLRGEGDGRALRRFTEDRASAAARIFTERAAAQGVTLRVDADILARAWVGELVATLTWWLESGSTLTPEQITGELVNLSLRGRYWASGFDDELPVRG